MSRPEDHEDRRNLWTHGNRFGSRSRGWEALEEDGDEEKEEDEEEEEEFEFEFDLLSK